MDRHVVFGEVSHWPVEAQFQFVQDVWDRLAETGTAPTPSVEEQAELDRRLAKLDADPSAVVDWQAIVQYVRRTS
jgi:putative addiction module component (TIGR02574 family)